MEETIAEIIKSGDYHYLLYLAGGYLIVNISSLFKILQDIAQSKFTFIGKALVEGTITGGTKKFLQEEYNSYAFQRGLGIWPRSPGHREALIRIVTQSSEAVAERDLRQAKNFLDFDRNTRTVGVKISQVDKWLYYFNKAASFLFLLLTVISLVFMLAFAIGAVKFVYVGAVLTFLFIGLAIFAINRSLAFESAKRINDYLYSQPEYKKARNTDVSKL